MTGTTSGTEDHQARLDVTDLLHAVTAAADGQEWEVWEALFADGAVVDYRGAGGRCGTPREVRSDLASDFEQLDLVRHLVTNVRVSCSGDGRATAEALFLSPVRGKPDHPASLVGGRYELKACHDGTCWRLTELVAHLEWWSA